MFQNTMSYHTFIAMQYKILMQLWKFKKPY
jgi:hypothetical protein